MSITIHIKEDLEKYLRQRAAAEGYPLDDYIAKILELQLPSKATQSSKQQELELLQKISLGIPAIVWERYEELKKKRLDETLSPSEHKELISISDSIEEANARRMPYLVELSKLRQLPLETLFQELGLLN